MDILDATWYELLISFLLTWTIGLTPPLLLRYLILRRPFKKMRLKPQQPTVSPQLER